MKKLILLLGLVIACNKANTNEENPIICSTPPPDFRMMINKTSELYKEFMNSEGKFDKENIFYYKLVNNSKQIYPIEDIYYTEPSGNVSLQLTTQLGFENDIYTGKTETLYLQNAQKTYKIEINGEMRKGECGSYAHINEIRVDGVKIEECYLAK